MRTLSFFLLLTLLSFAACKNNSAADQPEETPPAEKYTVTPFAPSTEFADASIESMEYKDGKFTFGIGGSTYQLGVQTPDADAKMCANSGKGQHIHLIVDNAPYSAQYTREFEYDIPDGDHYLLAFLSRSYHESIKTKAASRADKVSVANKSITSSAAVTEPMLFYSRPKGDYIGKKETDKVMLDFFLANCTLGTDYKVKAEINGEVHMIDKWQPFYIEGLPMGENTIKLTLVDKDGNTVNTPLNPVERTFNLKADQLEGN